MSCNTDITAVYKTYKNDLPWLYYSLLSLKKFVTGISEIIIYCHDVCCGELYDMIRAVNIKCRVIPVSYNFHGYLKQMVVKANCFKDVKTNYIVIIDSDNIFNVEIDMRHLIDSSGKIVWYYNDNIADTADERVWKISYEAMTKTPQTVHYMANGFPFIFTKQSMSDAHDKFCEMHGVDYDTFCINGCKKYNIHVNEPIAGASGRFIDMAKVFEEFEWLGYYCHNFSDDYIFRLSKFRTTQGKLLQFWSHGGITPAIKQQIETLLNS